MFDLLELERLLTTEMTPEYREQLAVVETYLDKLQKGFSFSFLDSFWSEACKLSAIESDDYFRAGLYLGASLTLALSQPPARIPRR